MITILHYILPRKSAWLDPAGEAERHLRPRSGWDRVESSSSRQSECVRIPHGAAGCAAPNVPSQFTACLTRCRRRYFTSTLAPASSNFFLMVAATSLFTPSLIGFGAPSTRSFASFNPRLVTSRTALMTLILLAPTSVSTTENSVFSSAGAAPAAAPPAAAAGAAAAAAETPQ